MNRLYVTLLATILTLGLSACEVEKKEEGRMPKVEVTDGNLPKYDVKTPSVDVTTEKKDVTVPTDIDIKTEKKQVDVPNIVVTPASEK